MCLVSEKKKRSRRTFTPEYRSQAARLVIETGRPIAGVAREIGVYDSSWGRWVAREREAMGALGSGELDVGERAELVRLRQENAELRRDNEFLGKASAFFASKSLSMSSSR